MWHMKSAVSYTKPEISLKGSVTSNMAIRVSIYNTLVSLNVCSKAFINVSDQDEHLHSVNQWGCMLWIYTQSHMRWEKWQGCVPHHSKSFAIWNARNQISCSPISYWYLKKRTDCVWSQCSKNNLPNTNAYLLQSQMNVSFLLLEMALGESLLFSSILLLTPVRSFHYYSSLILFQGVAYMFTFQLLVLQKRNA